MDEFRSQLGTGRAPGDGQIPTANVGSTYNLAPVTTSQTAAPLTQSQLPNTGPTLGMYCPGLTPLTTMLSSFRLVVDYLMYRLKDPASIPAEKDLNEMYILKRRIDSL